MNKTSNFKKILSAVLVLMMVMTTLVIVPMTASAEVVADTSWVNDNTGESWEDAYIIADAADLLGWSQLSNATIGCFDGKYFKLTNDIDLAGVAYTPIVAGVYNATGKSEVTGGAIHLDGQNHVIKNMTIASGSKNATNGTQVSNQAGAAFFLNLGDNSEIRNLHFVGANVTSTGTLANPAVLVAYGSLRGCTFSNISVDKTSTVTGGGIIGGLVAMVCDTRFDDTTDQYKTVFEYIVVGATVSCNGGAGRHGGIVGSWQTDCDLDFDYCGFTGTLNGANLGQMAAMVGTGMNGATTNPKQNVTMDNCYNTGTFDLSKMSGSASGSAVTATIGTTGRFGTSSEVSITNFYDAGNRITTTNFAGSLFAVGSWGFQNYNDLQVTLTDCFAAHQKVTMTDSSNYTSTVYGDNKAYTSDFTAPVALNGYNNHSGLYANENAGVPTAVVTNNNSWMVQNANAAITLTGASESTTINAEIAKIDSVIASKSLKDVQIDIEPLTARISLKDPYGFMLITDIQYTSNGADAALADVAEYGFYFLVAEAGQEMTAAELIANENAVKEEGEAYDGSTTKFASTYTALSAAKLDATVYFVAYATMAKGGVSKTVYSQVRSASPFTFVEDFKDGYIGAEGVGEQIENADEVATYVAMYDYHIAYKEYLDSVKKPQA